MINKKIKKLSAFILLGLSLHTPAVFATPIEIRFSHVSSESHHKGRMAIKFTQLIEQRLGDKFSVKVFPNSELYDNDVLDALFGGDVELAAPSISKIRKYSSRYQVFDLPFLFSSPKASKRFTEREYGDRLLRSLRQSGIYDLGYLDNGMRQMSANKIFDSPGDMAGLKFRNNGPNIAEVWMAKLALDPVKLSFSKVYEELERGNIDGQVNTWPNIYSKKTPYTAEVHYRVKS